MIRGIRAGGARARQLLGRRHAHAALHPAPDLVVGALFLVSQGVVQTLGCYLGISTLAGGAQGIALGPVASQNAIKCSAPTAAASSTSTPRMPFENSPRADELRRAPLRSSLIPAGLTQRPSGGWWAARRPGWALYGTMLTILLARRHRRRLRRRAGWRLPRRTPPASAQAQSDGSRQQPGGQGAAIRHRRSATWAAATTEASNGSVNSALDSYTGIGGLCPSSTCCRRGDIRRRRLGPVRDAAVRPARASSSPG